MNWEPWTGCYKISDGCTYCYFYGPYVKRHGQNVIEKTDEYSCAMKSQFREIGNHLSGTGNHLVANNASLLA